MPSEGGLESFSQRMEKMVFIVQVDELNNIESLVYNMVNSPHGVIQ